jgi:phosphatidate cytidylyltransferase
MTGPEPAAAAAGRWGDLRARVISGLAMLAVGIGAIWAGGAVFAALAVVVTGLMIWELARMTAPAQEARARLLGGLAVLVLAAVLVLHLPFGLAALALPPMALAATPRRDRAIALVYGGAVMLTGYGLVALREGLGLAAIGWIVAVVVTSDVAGYFAGRVLGGPKFWPRVSPKKTWSGTVAGWIGAALVGFAFAALTPGLSMATGGWMLVALSPLVAFAGQMGDIAESAIKRRAGVKDSSALIPGHGGVLDRFDALLGAVLVVLAITQIAPLPFAGG